MLTVQWVRKVVSATAGVLDALVYHSYNNDALASQETATFFLSQTLDQAKAYMAEAERASPPLPVILVSLAIHSFVRFSRHSAILPGHHGSWLHGVCVCTTG